MSPLYAAPGGRPDPFIVHVAGPPQLGGLRQDCTRCGHVLQDYVGKQVMVAVEPGEEAPPVLARWAEGAQVATLGGMSYLVQGRGLQADERECRPAS